MKCSKICIGIIIILFLTTLVFSRLAISEEGKEQKQKENSMVLMQKREETVKIESSCPIKVAILYERIGDGGIINRSIENEIKIFKETEADFIFRAFWLWEPCYEKCEDAPYQYLYGRGKLFCRKFGKKCENPYELGLEICKLNGYSYSHLQKTISKIKSEIPDIKICGAIGPEVLPKNHVYDPKTKEIINYPETWKMALDPSKWGINFSKEKFQCWYAKYHHWVPQDYDCENFDPKDSWAYFPDITNKRFQKLFLHWVERQIDAGVDAIWIDMLYTQAWFLYRMSKNANHSAVKESYKAGLKIIEKIRKYSERKGKYIFIGTWAPRSCVLEEDFPYYFSDLDFVTITPLPNEVKAMKLSETLWNNALKCIRQKYGSIPIIAFLDWQSTKKSQTGIFSQDLTKNEQREFLRIVDEFFAKRNVIFAYPVHGGFMGYDVTKKAFGFYPFYDSLAPEFQTYETIKELIQNRWVKSKLNNRTIK